MKVAWRKNVLYLVTLGYGAIIVMFASVCIGGGVSAKDAYDMLEGPLMALIGGSLAISKDLVPLGNGSDSPDRSDEGGRKTEDDTGQD